MNKTILLFIFLVLVPTTLALEVFETNHSVEINSTHITIISEENNLTLILNESINLTYNNLIYRTSTIEDEFVSLNSSFVNLSNSFNLLTVCNYTNITNINNYYNSTFNYTTFIINDSSSFNYTYNRTCTEINYTETNVDWYERYNDCHFNLTFERADNKLCQEEVTNFQGDSSCNDKITTCQNVLGNFVSINGQTCTEAIDMYKTDADEWNKFKGKIFMGAVVIFLLGAGACFLITKYNHPDKNVGANTGEDSEQTPSDDNLGDF